MSFRKITILATLLSWAPLFAQPAVHPDELALKPRIDAAIAKGVETLLNGQLRDGSWGEGKDYPVGRTALRVYALLKCGVWRDHPALKRAFAYLDTARTNKTYSLACAMLAYDASGAENAKSRIARLLALLLPNQVRSGIWGYPGGGDLSNTQYAALGLWVAHKAGLKVPAEVWNRLVDGTLRHQEPPHLVDVEVTDHTGVGKLEVAGFSYRAPSREPGVRSATGTMTTAGVSILKICEIGLGRRLRRATRKKIERGIQLGMNWFDAHFSVSHPQKPGKGGRWLLYYLYGMERVGALTRKEQFGKHWWYVAGAKKLLGLGGNRGSWGRAPHDSAFALLFLRRATSISGAVTGGGIKGVSKHLFSAGGPADDIALRGAGQKPVMLYINGFGKPLLAEHRAYGLRILRVEYFAGSRKLGEIPGDPTNAWRDDSFLLRCNSLGLGTHQVHVQVTLVDADCPPSAEMETVVIKSKLMAVVVRDLVEPWMLDITKMQAGNLLRGMGKKLVVSASSNQKTAMNACDGRDGTHWLAAPSDPTPTLTLVFPEAVSIRHLAMSQALKNRGDLDRVGVIKAVEVAWGKSRKFKRIEMNPNPLAPTEYELSRTRKVDRVVLRIVERDGRGGMPVGFAEITLAGRRRSR